MLIRASAHAAPAVSELPGPGLSVLALRAAEQDVLVLLGEADMDTSRLLFDEVWQALPAPPRPVVVELGALVFCDLAGLEALRDLARAAEAAGVVLTFRGPSAQLQWLQCTAPASRSWSSRQVSARTTWTAAPQARRADRADHRSCRVEPGCAPALPTPDPRHPVTPGCRPLPDPDRAAWRYLSALAHSSEP